MKPDQKQKVTQEIVVLEKFETCFLSNSEYLEAQLPTNSLWFSRSSGRISISSEKFSFKQPFSQTL